MNVEADHFCNQQETQEETGGGKYKCGNIERPRARERTITAGQQAEE
jgi:hypothetical protein